MTNFHTNAEDLNLDSADIQAHITGKAKAQEELDNAREGVQSSEDKVEDLKATAKSGGKVSGSTLANAHASVELGHARLKGAEQRMNAEMRRCTVTDLAFIQRLAPELSTMFNGKAPIVYGLGKAPRTLPDGMEAPLLVVTQESDSEDSNTFLEGGVTVTFFRNDLHQTLSESMLNETIGKGARNLRIQSLTEAKHGDVAKLTCLVQPHIVKVHRALTKGEHLRATNTYTNEFYERYGSQFGSTYDGLYAQTVRCKPVRVIHAQYDQIGNDVHVKDVSIDENGVQTVTATITNGWSVLPERKSLSYEANLPTPGLFPVIVQRDVKGLVGATDRTLGRITDVQSIKVDPVGGSNTFRVSMTVTTVSRI